MYKNSKKWINILTGALVLQAGLYFLLKMRQETSISSGKAAAPLLAFNFDELDKLTIEDGAKTSLELVKKDGVWHIPSHFGAPANADKISSFIVSLKDFKKTWPVGKTLISAKQFEVTDEKFERRVVFLKGETKLATLYFGSSPSFRKAHARLDGEDLTYSVAFNTIELPLEKNEWTDKSIAKIDRTKVATITVGGLTLKAQGADFALEGMSDTEAPNAEKIRSIVEKTLNPNYDEILSKDQSPPPTEILTVKIHLLDGKDVDLTYYESPGTTATEGDEKEGEKKSEDFIVFTSSLHPFLFKARKSKIEDLTKVTRDELVKPKEPTPKETGATEAPTSGEAASSSDEKASSTPASVETPKG